MLPRSLRDFVGALTKCALENTERARAAAKEAASKLQAEQLKTRATSRSVCAEAPPAAGHATDGEAGAGASMGASVPEEAAVMDNEAAAPPPAPGLRARGVSVASMGSAEGSPQREYAAEEYF